MVPLLLPGTPSAAGAARRDLGVSILVEGPPAPRAEVAARVGEEFPHKGAQERRAAADQPKLALGHADGVQVVPEPAGVGRVREQPEVVGADGADGGDAGKPKIDQNTVRRREGKKQVQGMINTYENPPQKMIFIATRCRRDRPRSWYWK